MKVFANYSGITDEFISFLYVLQPAVLGTARNNSELSNIRALGPSIIFHNSD